MKKIVSCLSVLLFLSASASPAPKARDLKPLADTLGLRLERRTGVKQDLKINRVLKRGNTLDLYFNSELAFYPWYDGDKEWFLSQLKKEWGPYSEGLSLGRIFTNGSGLDELVTPRLSYDGHPSDYDHKIRDPRTNPGRFIVREDEEYYAKGLSDRYIALWQSHGRYYDETEGVWMWQRARLHRTVEDMYTQTYVLPFLIPMLENAGAYVMTPRERDPQKYEVICDNDPSFEGEREGLMRRTGSYSERGKWTGEEGGFADFKRSYDFSDLPFKAGSVRNAVCSGDKPDAFATWTPDVPKRGVYAVYVSYKSYPNSNEQARYTVRHLGGSSVFLLNQKRGAQSWIYLGSFEFGPGEGCSVELDNSGERDCVVSADAVKFGGGMGKLEREGKLSGVASYMEGAHYWMQWAGADTSLTRRWEGDYTNDFATRGAWTKMFKDEKHIPFDLTLGFHSDAGIAGADSTVGTLAIYTLRNERNRKFEQGGRDRIVSRTLCDFVQSQIVADIREDFEPEWTRRAIWDRSYSESRTSDTPAMILELLSHQNYSDMKCGLDPAFRFTVSRAVYKGILKTLSEYYGCPYAVQPLPVSELSAHLGKNGDKAILKWQARPDPKEPTADPKSYLVYTRIDDGAFDTGRKVRKPSVEIPIEPGHIYSFKVVAVGEGGRSFPSSVVSVGRPLEAREESVLIVDNFDRVSAPAWIDAPGYAGFDSRIDSGVPYISDLGYIGENYDFDPQSEFIDNDAPGFGASYDNCAGIVVAGNSFDHCYIHGKAAFAAGYAFESATRDAFCKEGASGAKLIDLICGKQGLTKTGTGQLPDRFEVFPEDLRKQLRSVHTQGVGIFASGANVASDPKACGHQGFIEELFGCRLASPAGTRSGLVEGMPFYDSINEEQYCVERPDGLKPADTQAAIWLRYPGSSFGAAVYSKGKYEGSTSVLMGVPLETLKNPQDREAVMAAVLEYLTGRSAEPALSRK